MEYLLYAEAKLGEMLKDTPKPKFNKQINGSSKRTTEKTLPPGITKKESHIAQTVANNPERKAIYEELHLETKKPKGGRRPKNSEMISAFSDDTAQKTNVSPRIFTNPTDKQLTIIPG